jgi:hypothetical protein
MQHDRRQLQPKVLVRSTARCVSTTVRWHTSTVNVKKMMAVVVLVTLGAAGCSSDPKPAASTATTVPGVDMSAVKSFDGLSRNHVDGTVDYPQSPPVGGNHAPVWQNCGVYDTPIANENAVHSLEHGAVWLAYRPDLAADQVAVLRALALNQSHILVSPYPGLKEAVVATAWGKQLRLDSVTDPRLAVFVATYQEGPQTPELGATCSGGLGNPLA